MNRKNLQRCCPICTHALGEVLVNQRFVLPAEHPLTEGYDVVFCKQCGFAFADTVAPQKAYDTYYASLSKYADAATSTGAGQNDWDGERLEETARTIAAFEPDRSAPIADVGCGGGGLLRALAANGYTNLWGIDPAEGCVRAVRSLPNVRGAVGGLFDLPLVLSPLQGIVLSHVLEHVRDLEQALRGLHRHLEPGGWLYIEVPDATRYHAFVPSPFQDFNTEHINHFSPTALQRLCARAGYEPLVVRRKTILSAPQMPYPAQFLFARWNGSGVPVPGLPEEELRRDDPELREALERYATISQDNLARMVAGLAPQICGQEIIIWGTGQLVTKLLATSAFAPEAEVRIRCFVDSNPVHHGRLIHGVPVVPPNDLTSLPELPILIGSTINAASIRESLAERKLPNPIVTLHTCAE